MFRIILALFPLSTLFMTAADEAPDRWIVHYTGAGGGFETELHLHNTDFTREYQATLTPFAWDGTLLQSGVRTLTIMPGAFQALSREALEWEELPVSHVHASAPEPVRVSSAYRNQIEGAMAAEVASATETSLVARLAPVKGQAWFDGLVATNPNADRALVTISAHDSSGNTQASTQIEVPAGGKWLAVASDLLETDQPVAIYELRSDLPLLFLTLRGSLPGAQTPVLTQAAMDFFESQPAQLTYSNQVSRIMNRKCSFCHLDGGIGPFPLTSFEEVSQYKDYVEYSVGNGDMPPWRASDHCEELSGSQALDPLEKEMLLTWLQTGATQGEPSRAPQIETAKPAQWDLGQPDKILQYGEPFSFVPGPDVYRCFPLALENQETLSLKAYQVLPDNPEIVHHVLVFLEGTDEGQKLDSDEPGPGYTCFGGSGTGTFRLIAGWAPGMPPQEFRDGVGMEIPPFSTLIIQVHYHYSGAAGEDQTQVGLYFSETPHEKELLMLPLANTRFSIPPGAEEHEVTQSVTIPPGINGELHTIAPHMHLLGKTISVELARFDQEETCLIDIPRWDFNWQRFYEYPQPIPIQGGSTVTLRCLFDNSENNPNNPFTPPIQVGWGEETFDEMALAFLGVTFDSPVNRKGSWQWPINLDGVKGASTQIPASSVPNPLPSCCQPGGEKPWAVCPSTLTEKVNAPIPNRTR